MLFTVRHARLVLVKRSCRTENHTDEANKEVLFQKNLLPFVPHTGSGKLIIKAKDEATNNCGVGFRFTKLQHTEIVLKQFI